MAESKQNMHMEQQYKYQRLIDFLNMPQFHGEQKDKANKPYIEHLIRVSFYATQLSRNRYGLINNIDITVQDKSAKQEQKRIMEELIVATALLHDFFEDCGEQHKPIINMFLKGWLSDHQYANDVLLAMDILNKHTTNEDVINKNGYLARFNKEKTERKLADQLALVVKMADTLDNMNFYRLLNSKSKFKSLFVTDSKSEKKKIITQLDFNKLTQPEQIDFLEKNVDKNNKYRKNLEKYWGNWGFLSNIYTGNQGSIPLQQTMKNGNLNDWKTTKLFNNIQIQYAILNIDITSYEFIGKDIKNWQKVGNWQCSKKYKQRSRQRSSYNSLK